MATSILDELAVLLHKISREVDAAEVDDKLQDVYTTLEPTIVEFKRLGAKARLHDVPDTLWQSLTQTINTIMTLCEQRGLERERQGWASRWETFKQSYEKGKSALAAERKRSAVLKAEVETLQEKLKDALAHASSTGDAESRRLAEDEHLMRHMEHITAANDEKIKAIEQFEKLKASGEIAELKLNMVSKERDDAIGQVAGLQSQLDKSEDKAMKLQAIIDDLTSREPQFQNFRSSLHDMAPLVQGHQMHPNMHSPSTGTPPSLLRSMQHSVQHTPPPHLQANNQYQSSPPLRGSYHQSSPRHSAYHASPPPHSPYYQPGSPHHAYHQSSPLPGTAPGSHYHPAAMHGHHSRLPPRPRTNGRDATSRPQTSRDGANPQGLPFSEDFLSLFPGPHSDQSLDPGYGRPASKGVRWHDNLPDTPVMTMKRDVVSENERPTTSRSEVTNSADAAPIKETKSTASPTKTSASPVKTSPTKYGTLRRKLKGMRRPPYGYMTGTSSVTVGSEAALRLDHPIIPWEVARFQPFPRAGSVPAFVDEQLEAMKRALGPRLVALMWSKSCRRALRRRPVGGWQGVNMESLKSLLFGKAKPKKLAVVPREVTVASWTLMRAKAADRKPLGCLGPPVQIQVK